VLGEFKPSGKYAITDFHAVGGTPALLKMLLEEKLIDGNCLTVTGKTLAENLENVPKLTPGQTVIRPLNNPFKKTGHLRILTGNLAPEGAVAKITGKEGLSFTGPAKVFESEQSVKDGIRANKVSKGDVVVIRYEGPKGGPGMPEMVTPALLLIDAGLGKDVALITDGRYSGLSSGFIIGHITPEAQEGGPIALVKDGDIITIDAVNNLITIDLTEDELAKRKLQWKMPPYKAHKGALARYINDVSSASTGCITDRLKKTD
jgi:dihydroxy-acid dehydratase